MTDLAGEPGAEGDEGEEEEQVWVARRHLRTGQPRHEDESDHPGTGQEGDPDGARAPRRLPLAHREQHDAAHEPGDGIDQVDHERSSLRVHGGAEVGTDDHQGRQAERDRGRRATWVRGPAHGGP
jgi:hypothetical protein